MIQDNLNIVAEVIIYIGGKLILLNKLLQIGGICMENKRKINVRELKEKALRILEVGGVEKAKAKILEFKPREKNEDKK